MKNLIDETPFDPLKGRTLFTTQWVAPDDLRNKAVLDIGCGFGWFERFALQNGVQRMVGTELDDSNLETARRHLVDDRLTLVPGSAIDLPFPDASFDTVVSWEVIEHIPRQQEPVMYREVARILKPGGVFYLSTPCRSFFSNLLDPSWWLTGHRHYHPQELEGFARQAGLETQRLIRRGGWWELLGMLNLYVAKWIFRRRPFFAALFHKRLDAEYAREGGFSNLFAKHRKIGTA